MQCNDVQADCYFVMASLGRFHATVTNANGMKLGYGEYGRRETQPASSVIYNVQHSPKIKILAHIICLCASILNFLTKSEYYSAASLKGCTPAGIVRGE